VLGWSVWYAITRNPNGQRENLVAGAGFFGPPSEGSVEIGYSVIPSAQGLGFATEIVSALVDHAFTFSTVKEVIAHTSDSNPASIKVLLRCGFQRIGAGKEPETIQYRKASPHSA
jgi:RimJ/RimL family protein N-acetyltransferase